MSPIKYLTTLRNWFHPGLNIIPSYTLSLLGRSLLSLESWLAGQQTDTVDQFKDIYKDVLDAIYCPNWFHCSSPHCFSFSQPDQDTPYCPIIRIVVILSVLDAYQGFPQGKLTAVVSWQMCLFPHIWDKFSKQRIHRRNTCKKYLRCTAERN